MNIFYLDKEIPSLRTPVITFGSFDGLHLGHKALIQSIKSIAFQKNSDYALVTFEPHPRQVIYPHDHSLRLLNTLTEKLILFEEFGLANVVVAPFSVEFSQINADEYIEKFIVGKFNPSTVVIGYDHRFGINRIGDIHFLRWHASKYHYEVIEIDPQTVDQNTISSTKIRKCLETGLIKEANTMLGHTYFMLGTVIHGSKMGRTWGFPTANLKIDNPLKLIPPAGIYAAFAHIGDKNYKAVLYIGHKSTVQPHHPTKSIELHIFDFDEEIYGKTIGVEFVDYLRSDKHFEAKEQLIEQIKQDADQAKIILDQHRPFFSKMTIPS